MSDRRKHQRVSIPLECAWNGASCRATTRVADLSLMGCYVDSSQVPGVGEGVEIRVTTSDGTFTVRGEVIHASVGLGFAVEFSPPESSARTALTALLDRELRRGVELALERDVRFQPPASMAS